MEQNTSVVRVKVINENCHGDLTFGKVYEAVNEDNDGWYTIIKDDAGDEWDVFADEVELVEAPTLGGEMIKQKLEKPSKYEQCAEEAPVLWGAYKDKLNDEALEALMDVTLNSDWEHVQFDDVGNIFSAFRWNNTKQGHYFWKDVYLNKYDKPAVTAISEPSAILDNVTHTNTQDNKENAAGGLETPPTSALSTQIDGSHYSSMAIQPLEYAMANNLNACQFNVVKYVSRYKSKHGRVDLEKAIHCLQVLLELEYGEKQ